MFTNKFLYIYIPVDDNYLVYHIDNNLLSSRYITILASLYHSTYFMILLLGMPHDVLKRNPYLIARHCASIIYFLLHIITNGYLHQSKKRHGV